MKRVSRNLKRFVSWLVSAITQGSYIRYYTAVWYDTAALKEHRSRSRRDASTSGYPGDATLNLRLHALDRFVKTPPTYDPLSLQAWRKRNRGGNAVNSGVGRGGRGGNGGESFIGGKF